MKCLKTVKPVNFEWFDACKHGDLEKVDLLLPIQQKQVEYRDFNISSDNISTECFPDIILPGVTGLFYAVVYDQI